MKTLKGLQEEQISNLIKRFTEIVLTAEEAIHGLEHLAHVQDFTKIFGLTAHINRLNSGVTERMQIYIKIILDAEKIGNRPQKDDLIQQLPDGSYAKIK